MTANRNHTLYLVSAGIIWLIIQAAFLLSHGIALNGEPSKYINEANHFLNTGSLSSSNFRLYFVEILLIALAIKSTVGYGLVIAVHLIVNLGATLMIYTFVSKVFSEKTGFFCAILFLLNIPLQEFNVYLQTESLFYSFTILFSLYLLSIQNFTYKHAIFILLSIALLSITRPTGLLIIPPTFLYLFVRFNRSRYKKLQLSIASVLFIGFLFLLNNALGSGGEFDFMLPYQYEHIICGLPTIDQPAVIKTTSNSNSLYGIVYYVANNMGQFIKLACLKTVAFLGLFRPYYSNAHNILLAVLFYPLYIAAIPGCKWWYTNRPYMLLFLTGMIVVTWSSVMITCDDWHNRFFLSISFYVLILGLPAIHNLIKRLTSPK